MRYGRARRSQLGQLAGDSAYVSASQGASLLADLGQIVLITHILSLEDYGRFAVAAACVLVVGQLFDLRVGVAATIFGAQRVQRNVASAAGVFQFTYLVDAVTGVVAFVVVVALAPILGPAIVGEQGTLLIALYALTLLVSTVDESSFSVLRLLDRFRLLGTYSAVTEAVRLALVAVALVAFQSLYAVMLSLVLARALGGIAGTTLAARAFRAAGGGSLLRPALSEVRAERPAMLRTMVHTNAVSYSRLAQVHLPTIVLGALSGTFQAGVYKIGMGAATLVARLADPPYAALLPRLSRLWAENRIDDVRKLVRQATIVVVPAIAVAAGLLILLREPVLRILGGQQASELAGAVLILGAIGHAINSGLFWNIGVLFAAGRSKIVSRLAIGSALAQAALLIPLVNWIDATGAALAFLVTMVALNTAATLLAVGAIHARAVAQ